MKEKLFRSRRALLQSSAFGIGVAVLAGTGLIPTRRLSAADLPQLAEDDPIAQQLKYKHDATASERPDSSQQCNNCLYYKGAASDEWAACQIIPGKAVKGAGWCNTWTKKA